MNHIIQNMSKGDDVSAFSRVAFELDNVEQKVEERRQSINALLETVKDLCISYMNILH